LRRLALLLLVVVWRAEADYADYLYVPPPESRAMSGRKGLSLEELSYYLARPCPRHIFAEFEGRNALLEKEVEPGPAQQVAAGFFVGMRGGDLFGERAGHTAVAWVTSRDAVALRLLVDLSGLSAADALWLIDPTGPRAFGPFSVSDAREEGRWLPTVWGDTAVLMLEYGANEIPSFHLQALSHFFTGLRKALESGHGCPIPVGCERDPAFQEVASGVGMLIIPSGAYGHVQCTGALLNNPGTAALESYLITASHCLEAETDASQIEVVWDYRAADCAGEGIPALPDLPRSQGEALLAADRNLDGALLRLEGVPVGQWGRAWLGWDTRTLEQLDAMAGAHHPMGTSMKLCQGRVQETDVRACMDFLCTDRAYHQTQVQWDEGITAGGSSGSPLLVRDGRYRVVGMLSNGPVHDCDTPSQNIDNFASFARFFPEIACYLIPGGVCEPASKESPWCPAKATFGTGSETVSRLRSLRDRLLRKTAAGRAVTGVYYAGAPLLSKAVEASETVRALFAVGAMPFAWAGAWLESFGAGA